MKTQITLVRTDAAVHLGSKTAVYLDIALVIHPGYPKRNDPLWFDQPFHYFVFSIFRVFSSTGSMESITSVTAW